MNEKKQRTTAQTILTAAVAGVVAATVVSLAVVHYVPGVYKSLASGGEDEPIVVAGGSMHLRAAKGEFRVRKDKAIYEHEKGHVTSIDVLYYDNAGPAFDHHQIDGAKASVGLSYCDPRANCSPATLETGANGHGLSFYPVGNDSTSNGNHQISHAPEDGYIDSVTLGGKTYACLDAKANKGRCTVIVHYCNAAVCF